MNSTLLEIQVYIAETQAAILQDIFQSLMDSGMGLMLLGLALLWGAMTLLDSTSKGLAGK